MRKYLQYLRYVVVHKWYVFLACWRLGIPLLGFVHDWSKFLPDEFISYTYHFFVLGKGTKDPDFDYAWLSHVHRNKHHPLHWVLLDKGEMICLEMPDHYLREAVADWYGAGKAQGKDDLRQYVALTLPKMLIHHESKAKINEYVRRVLQ